jgi:methylated-DNA-protein-cysteine methyltransferase-like protein
VAAGFGGVAVADFGRMDCIVKEASRSRALTKKGAADRPAEMRKRIERAIRAIPRGKVSTYGSIARAAGLPGGARLVARVLHRSYGLPWQRVLGAGGEIKLRGDSAIEQRLRLEAEGVRFRGRKVDMKQCEFKFMRASRHK